MKKYPRYIKKAHYLGSNVYLTKEGDIIGVIALMGTRDLKIKQICFESGRDRIFIVVE